MPLDGHLDRNSLRNDVLRALREAAGREPVYIPIPDRGLPAESLEAINANIAKRLSLGAAMTAMEAFGEDFQAFMRHRDILHLKPLTSLAAGVYLAAEVLLTGSLLSAAITGAAFALAEVALDEVGAFAAIG